MKIKTMALPYEQVMALPRPAYREPKRPNLFFRTLVRAAAAGDLKDAGLQGIETVYSTYTEAEERQMKKTAEKYGLLESGGSDFHGTNKEDIDLGTGRGNLRVPYSIYERMEEYWKNR